jgi:hypothetical protein
MARAANKRPDHTKYPAFYRDGGYGFLPQVRVDDFRKRVSEGLHLEQRKWKDEAGETKRDWGDTGRLEDPWERWAAGRDMFRLMCSAENHAEEVSELLFLLDELTILAIYRFIEVERTKRLSELFPHLDRAKLSRVEYLHSALPFTRSLFGAEQVNELRLICNCIKHSGTVSRQLAKANPGWKAGKRLSSLREAYDRLAPFVGAYWVHFVYSAKDAAR